MNKVVVSIFALAASFVATTAHAQVWVAGPVGYYNAPVQPMVRPFPAPVVLSPAAMPPAVMPMSGPVAPVAMPMPAARAQGGYPAPQMPNAGGFPVSQIPNFLTADGKRIATCLRTTGGNVIACGGVEAINELMKCTKGIGVSGGCFGPNGELMKFIRGPVGDVVRGELGRSDKSVWRQIGLPRVRLW
jgi:hypothetical protein